MAARRLDVDLRKVGLRHLREADSALAERRPREAEEKYKSALRALVEAFLEDRLGNSDLFGVVHRVGREYESRFGCRFDFDEKTQEWVNDCPVQGLHARVGFSIGAAGISTCSVCGADELECDHVPGLEYDGEVCIREIVDMALDHVAITPTPDFTSTFIQTTRRPKSDFKPLPGQVPVSVHCRDCYGIDGPTEDDLEPSLWPPLDAG